MEKRRVTISIGGQPCSFYSDDSDEYISALERKTNAVMRQAARYSGSSSCSNAVIAVLLLTDKLLRTEPKAPRKPVPKAAEEDKGQMSVWDLLEDRTLQ